jgi:hypothetical protein
MLKVVSWIMEGSIVWVRMEVNRMSTLFVMRVALGSGFSASVGECLTFSPSPSFYISADGISVTSTFPPKRKEELI